MSYAETSFQIWKMGVVNYVDLSILFSDSRRIKGESKVNFREADLEL